MISAKVCSHLSEFCGLIAHWQGMERYMFLDVTKDGILRIGRRWYGKDEVLASMPVPAWRVDSWHTLSLECKGTHWIGTMDGCYRLEADDARIMRGGAGIRMAKGHIGFAELAVK